MQTEKLSISLPSDMARMIRRQVEEGGYASNSEVIRDALRLWQQRAEEKAERLDALRAGLDKAADHPMRYDAASVTAHFDKLAANAQSGKAGTTDRS